MNVLSLFDGISCGQLALQRAGIKYDNYYASEIYEPAIKVTQYNFPKTIQIGNVENIDFSKLKPIDLLLGGSPCQDISNLNKDQKGLKGSKSSLFYKYLEAKKILNPKDFIFENVNGTGNKETLLEINKSFGLRPIRLDSRLVSAQTRDRLYWTNITVTDIPKNKRIKLSDILQTNVSDKYYQSNSWNIWWAANKEFQLKKGYSSLNGTRANCLTARMYTSWNGNFIQDEKGIRRLTPIECERLQTMPDGYTSMITDSQAYKCLGDCWTVDIIAHILKYKKN